MWLTSWLRKRPSNAILRNQRPAPARFRPRLEALEDRLVPAFTHSAVLPVGAPYPQAILTADLNGDGKADIITGNEGPVDGVISGQGPSISVLLARTGKSGFETAQTTRVPVAPTSLVAGDFNNDGKLDLAVGGGGYLSVLLGNGNGTFLDPSIIATSGGVVTVGHFNGDSNLDLVIKEGVLWGHGDGTFGSSAYSDPFALGGGYRTPGEPRAIGDADQDGRPEFIVLSAYDSVSGNSTISVLPVTGNGTFGAPQTIDASFTVIKAIAVAQFNADSKLDIAVATLYPSEYGMPLAGGSIDETIVVHMFLDSGNGTFNWAGMSSFDVVALSSTPIHLAACDVNRDGTQDLITVGTAGAIDEESVLLGNGDGTYRSAPSDSNEAAAD